MVRQRVRRARLPAALGIVLLVAACGPAPASAPAGAPAGGAGAGGAAGEAAAAAPADAPAGWEETVAAAKQEGTLVLSGPPGQLWRDGLLLFEKDYPGIKVELTGQNSRDYWPRVFQERAAGQYLWDLRVGGPDPQVFQARDGGALDPVRPLLVLPEVTDESKWFGGFDGLYADAAKQYLPAFIAQSSPTAYVNRGVVSEADLSSDRQLVEPRWRGKIAIADPAGGAGLGTLTTLLAAYGEDYVQDLLSKQDLAVTGDNRQLAEWVVRGRYPIGIGVTDDELLLFQQQGLTFDVRGLGGARKLSLGFGGIQLMNRAPHPNAAKVFANWLLTRDTQARLAPLVEFNSRRTDVPPVSPADALDPSHLQDYVPHQYEELLPTRQRAQQLGKDLLAK
ncbi:MAG TPA: extracellular solute-binding protein [Chloroflexota bacterium]|nr:extracellular solute-binding protein [Chloroflexota bacterium]